ncbi:MAG: porin [Hymenobacteraceae bacterium]|nr:porin [Hymenobacteraceae bacterium]MDX5395034.1 porin [Hymenobacteraceae bacterium]MDX5443510.1 porin [Hymenobacteraceae bacterium]MDX5511068.1 porin [Hymenobacteraceae bacterium]
MLQNYFRNFLMLLLCLFAVTAQAQPGDTTDTVATTEKPFKLTGAVDVYYAYDFSQPANRYRQFTTQAYRHNEFNLNYGYLKAAYEQGRVRATLLLHTGTYVQANYAAEPNTLTRLIGQAYAGIRFGTGTWLDVGVLPSHIGYESTFSGDNVVYTRALMAENSPYYETGARLTHSFSERLTATVLLLNGWQNIHETNNAKSFGAGLSYSPSEKLNLSYNNYYGNEAPDSMSAKYRFFNNFNVKYIFSKMFTLGGSFDFGTQELIYSSDRGNWYAALLVAQYRLSERYAVAARLEHYNDNKQVIVETGTANGFQTSSLTCNFDYQPMPNALLRLEARGYKSKDAVFLGKDGAQENNALLTAAVTVKF